MSVAGPALGGGFDIGIADTCTSPVPDEAITISSGGLASSGIGVRNWRLGEHEVHHIVDPATGLSALALLADSLGDGGDLHTGRRSRQRQRWCWARAPSIGWSTAASRRGWCGSTGRSSTRTAGRSRGLGCACRRSVPDDGDGAGYRRRGLDCLVVPDRDRLCLSDPAFGDGSCSCGRRARWGWRRGPLASQFLSQSLHRNLSLFCVVLIGVHVVTTVGDGYVPIGLADAIIPFRSPYRPIWVGLGAVAFDMLLAVAISSALRRRIGVAAWRGVRLGSPTPAGQIA